MRKLTQPGLFLFLLMVMVGLGSTLGSAPATAQTPSLSPVLLEQILALRDEKIRRTPAERKLTSSLLYQNRMRRGEPPARGIASLRTGVEVGSDGRTTIDLRGDITPRLLARVRNLGGKLIHSAPDYRRLRARIPLNNLVALATLSDVEAIRPADRAYTRKIDTSEGDVAHLADQLRSTFSIDGSGVSIGVLSDGVDTLAARQATDDVSASVTVLPGEAGAGDEGTAMLEILTDLAPGADLLFATAFTSQASFAANIIALRDAGADVIVDDVGYFAESVFQDDNVADSVATVSSTGVLYFSSAGNSGNLNDGTSGVWEGDYVFSGITVNGDPAHDFGAGVFSNQITLASPSVYTLHWSDPNGGSGNDYDLLLVNSAVTTLISASTNSQAGSDDPFEIIGASAGDVGRRLIIVKFSGADRFLHLSANRGRLLQSTAGQTSGHAAARDAFGVAAVDARPPAGPFVGTESVQVYSSDGPRRVFFEANGTAITPGDFSSTGGELRQKPDLAAADCVDTSTPGFDTFCGTSAAAPHAAAIAALLLDLPGPPTPVDIRSALLATALDIEAPGTDRDSGAGLIDSLAAGTSLAECLPATACDDGDPCTANDLCDAFGVCQSGTPFVCTSPGVCEIGPGTCNGVGCDYSPDTGAACDDGDPCTAGDLCSALAVCESGTPFTCDSPGTCEDGPGICNGVGCDYLPNTGAICDDGLFCNGTDSCLTGACSVHAGSPCQGVDGDADCAESCDEFAEDCFAPDPFRSACDDGLACSFPDFCLIGFCLSGPPVDCDDVDACTADSCDQVTGCANNPIDCDDQNVCTADSCDAIAGCLNDPIPGCMLATPVPSLGRGGQVVAFLALLTLGALYGLRVTRPKPVSEKAEDPRLDLR